MGIEVDPAFIQPIEHQQKAVATVDSTGIPLIDLSPLLDANNSSLSGLVAEVEAACREWGFFQVINHGVPSELLDRLLSAAKEFFALPAEEKRRVRRDEVNPMGYYDGEHTKNVRDWKEVYDFVAEEHQFPASSDPESTEVQTVTNQWPQYPPHLREASEEYVKEVVKLSYKLLELISLSLKLPATRLNGFFKDQMSNMRINYYPPCPTPDLTLGVGPHRDVGALSVLAQDDVGGLEVRRKSDGEWIGVKPIPNSYIINVGSITQVWSNDKYESAEHRVSVNSKRARFSIPFFFYPAHYTMVAPLEELLDEKNPALYREYNLGKFMKTRKNSNFKKLAAENIQIHHFRKFACASARFVRRRIGQNSSSQGGTSSLSCPPGYSNSVTNRSTPVYNAAYVHSPISVLRMPAEDSPRDHGLGNDSDGALQVEPEEEEHPKEDMETNESNIQAPLIEGVDGDPLVANDMNVGQVPANQNGIVDIQIPAFGLQLFVGLEHEELLQMIRDSGFLVPMDGNCQEDIVSHLRQLDQP